MQTKTIRTNVLFSSLRCTISFAQVIDKRMFFIFQPLKNPSADCWFSNKPIGYNKLDGTVARLCKNAGIPGYRTNHSLRAITAIRLYQAAVDEQLIMERTGHRSLDGVRSYKRTSNVQQEKLSSILNGSMTETNNCVVNMHHSGTSTSLTNNVIQTPPTFNFHSCTV